jgi:hypothetical protein
MPAAQRIPDKEPSAISFQLSASINTRHSLRHPRLQMIRCLVQDGWNCRFSIFDCSRLAGLMDIRGSCHTTFSIVNRQLKPGVWLRPRRALEVVAHIFGVSPFSTLDSRPSTASGGRSPWLVSPYLPGTLASNESLTVPAQFAGQIV